MVVSGFVAGGFVVVNNVVFVVPLFSVEEICLPKFAGVIVVVKLGLFVTLEGEDSVGLVKLVEV